MTTPLTPAASTTSDRPGRTPAEAVGRPARLRRTRTTVLLVGYSLLSLWAVAMSVTGIAVLVIGLPDPSLHFVAVAASCFKILTLCGAVAVLLSRGRSVLAVRSLVVGQVAWMGADLVAPQSERAPWEAIVTFVVTLAIWVGPWLLCSTGRSRLWRGWQGPRISVAALTVLAAAPLVLWSLTARDTSLPNALDAATGLELRFDLAGLPLALLGAWVLCALHRALWWDLLVGTVSTVIATLCVIFPDEPGSPGVVGALLLTLPLALLLDRRRSVQQHSGPA